MIDIFIMVRSVVRSMVTLEMRNKNGNYELPKEGTTCEVLPRNIREQSLEVFNVVHSDQISRSGGDSKLHSSPLVE